MELNEEGNISLLQFPLCGCQVWAAPAWGFTAQPPGATLPPPPVTRSVPSPGTEAYGGDPLLRQGACGWVSNRKQESSRAAGCLEQRVPGPSNRGIAQDQPTVPTVPTQSGTCVSQPTGIRFLPEVPTMGNRKCWGEASSAAVGDASPDCPRDWAGFCHPRARAAAGEPPPRCGSLHMPQVPLHTRLVPPELHHHIKVPSAEPLTHGDPLSDAVRGSPVSHPQSG